MKKFILIFLLAIACTLSTRQVLGIERPQIPEIQQSAQEFYENGDFSNAIERLQAEIRDYSNRRDRAAQSIALRNLALLYLEMGDLVAANTSIEESLQIVKNLENKEKILAQILEVQGKIQLLTGNPDDALETWETAIEIYQDLNDINGIIQNTINQTQALQSLGLYRQSRQILERLQSSVELEPDSILKAKALQSLGDVLHNLGDTKESIEILNRSLTIAKQFQDREIIASILISLGNATRLTSEKDEQQALNYYQEAASLAPSTTTQLEAQLNQFNLLIAKSRKSEALSLIPHLETNLNRSPLNHSTIYARIHFARHLMELEDISPATIAQRLAVALQAAQKLGDRRAQAYALGNLGKLYTQNQRWDDAQTAIERGLAIAQTLQADDIAYQWQWQLGKIFRKQGKRKGAIAAYSGAIHTLQSIRRDLVTISSEVQFSFTESIEPLYREFVDLLLQPNASQDDLIQARQAIEALQLAELDNFFREACTDAHPVQIDRIDPKSAVFYSILLRDRVEIILALPEQPLRHYTTPVSQKRVEESIEQLRKLLFDHYIRANAHKKPAQNLYDWVIRPAEQEIANSNADTLAFVLDGALRNIPTSILHNGQQYLIEKYAIAIAPGLQLLNPQPLTQQELTLLAAGLSQARQGFSALPNVEPELEQIQTEIPTEILLNESFTEQNFSQLARSSPAPIIHLATHGQFSSNAADTFILTWDNKIDANELRGLLEADPKYHRPIELLILSACQTAKGDKRAALGLAGIAVRAGARSTLASLWSVSDEATAQLMTQLYRELTEQKVTKAQALRNAQLALLNSDTFSHPYYWGAFVLVGNWL
ncbi:CHAT domain-containing protein [Lusitaniella coriacea LEGE 07157]|uniref:CHAT domain-containing protein n=1 Tax=Lusitaniella coriacea LEGE 07157 TaxID=945747 RepID=A0A8J7DVZ1_9CYAN|nr:CHAT domain-containing protein [Lusitaniella coriacea]MBE9116033.1 CHAT domain-containing protein [Lusitaniella coriacea LEGE 07157]